MQILYWAPCVDFTSSDNRDPYNFSQDQFQIENQLSLVNFWFIPHTCNFNFSYNGVLVLGEKWSWSLLLVFYIVRVNIHNGCDTDFIILYIAVQQSPFEMIVAIGYFRCIFYVLCIIRAKNYVQY